MLNCCYDQQNFVEASGRSLNEFLIGGYRIAPYVCGQSPSGPVSAVAARSLSLAIY
jgi:hypothetical protein